MNFLTLRKDVLYMVKNKKRTFYTSNKATICDLNNPEIPCINPYSSTPSQDVKKYSEINQQLFKGKYHVNVDMKMSGAVCFDSGIRSASLFLFLFILATLFLNMFHEIIKVFYLLSYDIVPSSTWFSISGGLTSVNRVALEEKGVFVLLFYQLLPLIFNGFLICLLILCFKTEHIETPKFHKLKHNVNHLEIFIKALGYVAALNILMSILFSFFFLGLYEYVGLEYTSLYQDIWQYCWNISPSETININNMTFNLQSLVFWILFISSSLLITLAFYFIFAFGKKTFVL